MVRAVVDWDPTIIVRPVQIAYLVLTFKAFGNHATLYHFLNTALLALATAFLYLAIRKLELNRWLAIAIALVYGLLPHYSTDRFWIAEHQTTLSMALAFLGIYALLRSVPTEQNNSTKLAVIAAVSLVLSLLSYEVALGLIIAVVGFVCVRKLAGLRSRSKLEISKLVGISITMIALLACGIIKLLMQTRMAFPHRFPAHFTQHTVHILTQAVRFNFWTYGLHMPAALLGLYRHSALSGPAVSCAFIVALSAAIYLSRSMGSSAIPSRKTSLGLIFIGLILFFLGCALFFADDSFDLSSAGIGNRIAIASALGAACVLVAIAGLVSSIPRSPIVRVRVYSIAIGLICGMNCLVLSGLGFFWDGAASQQTAILASVTKNVRSLPSGSVLLLDGFCRYYGPGIVFQDDWDTSGALQITLNDATLKGDVISRNLHFSDAGVQTTMYGEPEAHYGYGDYLFVYNVRNLALMNLSSAKAAGAYLRAMNPEEDSGCPAVKEGEGGGVF